MKRLKQMIMAHKACLVMAILIIDLLIRLFLETGTGWQVFGHIVFGFCLIGSIASKRDSFKYALLFSSGLLFYLNISSMDIGFYYLLSFLYPLLLIYAYLLPNPIYNVFFSMLFIVILWDYRDSVEFSAFDGNVIGLMMNGVVYTVLVRLVRKLEVKNKILNKMNEDTSSLISLIPEPVFIHDEQHVLYANKEGLRLMGISEPSEIYGLSIYEQIHPNYHQDLKEKIDLVLRENRILKDNVFKLQIDQQLIDIECTAVRINYKGSQCLLTVVNDITVKQKRTEEMLLKSDKLKIVGQMAAGIAHEIRNPLTSIKGFLQLMKREGSGNIKDYTDIMLCELERINLIVSEFLFLSKPQTTKYEDHNILSIINSVLKIFTTQTIMNNVEVKVNCSLNLPLVHGDANHLKQVIINLMKNAIEAMPHGGLLTIEVSRFGLSKIKICIKDEGCGISQERLNSLGEPFYTTKERGTGLGLMVCYKIIENHLGNMFIESEVNKGTNVEILLPISQHATAANRLGSQVETDLGG